MKKFFSDFKKFISKGNIMDLAIAVVVGGAFGKIVTSLVNDIIMPIVGLATGGQSVEDLKWVFKPAEIVDGVLVSAENALRYGTFLQTVIDFLIISFCIFIVFKVVNASTKQLEKLKNDLLEKMKHEEKKVSENTDGVVQIEENSDVVAQIEEVKEVLTDAQRQELLLTEIRDLLKTNVVVKSTELEDK